MDETIENTNWPIEKIFPSIVLSSKINAVNIDNTVNPASIYNTILLPFVSNIGKYVINNRIKLNTEITNPPIINTTKTKISVGANSS